eukprot:Rhum_TRINITY_DN14713_c11_g1::Rhum_TRINITY_DN14713_c11_g1_i1::g.111498::m.111498
MTRPTSLRPPCRRRRRHAYSSAASSTLLLLCAVAAACTAPAVAADEPAGGLPPAPTPTVPLRPASRARRGARLLGDGEPPNLPPTTPLPPATAAPDDVGRADGNTTAAATPPPPPASSGSGDGESGIAVSIVFGTLAGVILLAIFLYFVCKTLHTDNAMQKIGRGPSTELTIDVNAPPSEAAVAAASAPAAQASSRPREARSSRSEDSDSSMLLPVSVMGSDTESKEKRLADMVRLKSRFPTKSYLDIGKALKDEDWSYPRALRRLDDHRGAGGPLLARRVASSTSLASGSPRGSFPVARSGGALPAAAAAAASSGGSASPHNLSHSRWPSSQSLVRGGGGGGARDGASSPLSAANPARSPTSLSVRPLARGRGSSSSSLLSGMSSMRFTGVGGGGGGGGATSTPGGVQSLGASSPSDLSVWYGNGGTGARASSSFVDV